MSGFSHQWLSLREPVDHISINRELRTAVSNHFASKNVLHVTDLGSGSGSSLRGLAADLPLQQHWRLVDYDRDLLDYAREALCVWADISRQEDEILILKKNQHEISIELVQADLAQGVPDRLLENADVVTSSAFFDLVSARWIAEFSKTLAAHSLPLYAMLTYDGSESWQPPHPADTLMLPAFHRDQNRDKGFGPAAGPVAASALENALRASGYSVLTGDSPWMLGKSEQILIRELATGSAAAIAATNSVDREQIDSWRDARQNATSCRIGHRDVFAVPV